MFTQPQRFVNLRKQTMMPCMLTTQSLLMRLDEPFKFSKSTAMIASRNLPHLLKSRAFRHLALIPVEAKNSINVFLQQDPDTEGLAVSAPEANAYEFQSSKIIDMLAKLMDKFVDERTTLEKEEMNAKHAHQLLMQDLQTEIGSAETDHADKSALKAKCLQEEADAKGDLGDTTATRADDHKYLTDLVGTCQIKAKDFEARQALRAQELEAIQKAMEIISSSTVSGAADEHLPSFSQQRPSFAQFMSTDTNPLQKRVSHFLQDRARRINSRVLAALADHVAVDPFSKIKKMIKDLIVRLMEEANEEAEHKGWCDTELSTNEQTRKQKTQAVELLHAEIDELEASITKLTEDIGELTKDLADLEIAMTEATKLRAEEKAKNADTIADADAAQVAVAQALAVLREFYAKAAEATAFVQQQPEVPEIFDSPYTGMAAESGGVIGMLEVIEKDFGRLSADTQSSEASAQREYDDFIADSRVDKATKTSTLEHKTAKRQDEEQTLTGRKSDLEGTQKELDAALAYFDKLKPSCVDSGVSYDDRVSRRKEEIESLQEALRILNGEDLS